MTFVKWILFKSDAIIVENHKVESLYDKDVEKELG